METIQILVLEMQFTPEFEWFDFMCFSYRRAPEMKIEMLVSESSDDFGVSASKPENCTPRFEAVTPSRTSGLFEEHGVSCGPRM
jgi:hypothetical protein